MQRIEFHYESEFRLAGEGDYRRWVIDVINSESRPIDTITYIFCSDNYLLKLHRDHLGKDSLTDIITFEYDELDAVSGDIFISVERVKENAGIFNCSFEMELKRVMAHGLLHLMGFNDKTDEEVQLMRKKENEKIDMFHVEH